MTETGRPGSDTSEAAGVMRLAPSGPGTPVTQSWFPFRFRCRYRMASSTRSSAVHRLICDEAEQSIQILVDAVRKRVI